MSKKLSIFEKIGEKISRIQSVIKPHESSILFKCLNRDCGCWYCPMPEDRELAFQCPECKGWFTVEYYPVKKSWRKPRHLEEKSHE